MIGKENVLKVRKKRSMCKRGKEGVREQGIGSQIKRKKEERRKDRWKKRRRRRAGVLEIA